MTSASKRKRKSHRDLGIRISKPLAWTEKYLRRVKNRMPTIRMPKTIRSFKPNPKKRHLTLGSCCRSDRSINIATHEVKKTKIDGKKRRLLAPLSRIEILQTLAHELSHLTYDHHGYEQEWFGRTIFNTFGITEPCPHCDGRGKIPAMYRNT